MGDGLAGVMFTAMTPGAVTVTLVLALTEPYAAVTSVVPRATVLRFPLLSIVATAVLEELHCVCFVTSADVPSWSCAIARKLCESPSGSVGFAGEMDRDTGVLVPGVLLMVQAARVKQTSTGGNQAHLEQLRIYVPAAGYPNPTVQGKGM